MYLFIWFFIISMVELQIAIKSSKKLYFLDHKNDWWVQIYDKYANTSLQLPFWNGFLYNKILKVCTVGDVLRSGFFSESEQKKIKLFEFFIFPTYINNNIIYWQSILQKHPRAFFSYPKSIYVVLLQYVVVVVEEEGGCIITFLAFFQKYHRNINTKKYN